MGRCLTLTEPDGDLVPCECHDQGHRSQVALLHQFARRLRQEGAGMLPLHNGGKGQPETVLHVLLAVHLRGERQGREYQQERTGSRPTKGAESVRISEKKGKNSIVKGMTVPALVVKEEAKSHYTIKVRNTFSSLLSHPLMISQS